MSKNKAIGTIGELHAKEIYVRKGFSILESNFFNHRGKQLGEIDVIAVKDKDIRFVEVKTRTNNRYGEGIESINYFKQKRMLRIAQLFLARNPKYLSFQPHFDVATVQLNRVDNSLERIRIYVDVIVDYY